MSVRKFLIFFVIVFVSGSCDVYAACSDNDGANIYIGGTVTLTNPTRYFYDMCDASDNPETCSLYASFENRCGITERTCVSGGLNDWITACPQYFSCYDDGISGHGDYCVQSWDCTDSDSDVYSVETSSLFVGGHVTQWSLWGIPVYHDSCESATVLREMYCTNTFYSASALRTCANYDSSKPYCVVLAGEGRCVECTQESHCAGNEDCINNQCVVSGTGCTDPTANNGQYSCRGVGEDVMKCNSGIWNKIADCGDYDWFTWPCMRNVARNTENEARDDCTQCGDSGEPCCSSPNQCKPGNNCNGGICVLDTCVPVWGSCGGCTPTDCSGCWGTRSDGCGHTESCWINPNGCSSGVCCGGSCCLSGQICYGEACCSVTNPQSQKQCVNGNLYWYDNCGQMGSLAETCDFGCNSAANPDICNACSPNDVCCIGGYITNEGAPCGGYTEYRCSSGNDSCGDRVLSRNVNGICSNGICEQGGESNPWTETEVVCGGTKYCIGGSLTCGDCNFTGQAGHLCEKDFSCQNNATGWRECFSDYIPAGEFCYGYDCSNLGVCNGTGTCLFGSENCGSLGEPCCGVGNLACQTQCAEGGVCSGGWCASCLIDSLVWEREGVVGGYAVEGQEISAVVLGNTGCDSGVKLGEFTIYNSDDDEIEDATDSEKTFDSSNRAEFTWVPFLEVGKKKEDFYFLAGLGSTILESPNITVVEECIFYEEDGALIQISRCADYAKTLSDGKESEESCWADCANVVAGGERGPNGETGQCTWGMVEGEETCFFVYQPAGSPDDADYYCKVENEDVPICGPEDAVRVITLHNLLVNKTTGAESDNPLCYGSCGGSVCEIQTPCPKIVELPFFGVWNAVGVVIILVVVYIIYSWSKKKKTTKKRKKR